MIFREFRRISGNFGEFLVISGNFGEFLENKKVARAVIFENFWKIKSGIGGYLYFHKAPNAKEFHEETLRKLNRLHMFDCARANKSTSAWGPCARIAS